MNLKNGKHKTIHIGPFPNSDKAQRAIDLISELNKKKSFMSLHMAIETINEQTYDVVISCTCTNKKPQVKTYAWLVSVVEYLCINNCIRKSLCNFSTNIQCIQSLLKTNSV